MPTVGFDSGTLVVQFTGWQSLMVRRRELRVPLTTIERVTDEPGWTSEVLGLRSGLVVSGWYKLATFTHPDGTRRLVAMRRGQPLLRVRFADRAEADGLDELLISTPDAARLAGELATGAGRSAG